MVYVDLFVDQIGKYSVENNVVIDMIVWFNWIIFDIIGDLLFGEFFYGFFMVLYYFWILMLFEVFKMIVVGVEFQCFLLI